MPLDRVQQQAVLHYKGPAMILAGPGSGKTTVITHRIRNLLCEYGVRGNKILVITFTKMAAVQMKERFESMIGGESDVSFATFHACFFMILKRVYNYKASDIVKTGQQWQFFKTQLSKYGIAPRDEHEFISDIIALICNRKSLGGIEGEYICTCCDKSLFERLYIDYNKWLSDSHLVDFEDMMVKTYELLTTNKEELMYWQNRYEFILVDEFQDASPVQYEITRLLAGKYNNIFIVGDDDQSIYGFRGAVPGIMQKFSKDYKECVRYNLNVNYRSCSSIVNSATALINCNKDRFFKEIKSHNTESGVIEYKSFETAAQEYEYIAQDIINAINNKNVITGNDSVTTIAVLTRTNAGAKELIELLGKKNVPVFINKKRESLMNHWIARDIASYVRLACGSHKRFDYLRIINKPVRYISRDFFIEEDVDTEKLMLRLSQSAKMKSICKNMEILLKDIEFMKNMPPIICVNYILNVIGYLKYIDDYCTQEKLKTDVFDNVISFITDKAKESRSMQEFGKIFDEDKEDEKNKEDKEDKDNAQVTENALAANIHIFTMHSAKGLEFDKVYIIDVNEGIIPYEKAVTKEQLEEERRLFYVGVTRAKKKLILCNAKNRYNKKLEISRYIGELLIKE